MNKCNHSFKIWVALFASIVLFTFFNCKIGNESEIKHDSSKYLNAVILFSENILNYGLDNFGNEDTPLFIDGLNIDTLHPVTWKNEGQEWILSNFANQQNLLRTLVGLSDFTGDDRYRIIANKAVEYALKNLQSPNYLLYWGGHYLYDAKSDIPTGDDYQHELKCHYPFYELLYNVDPGRTTNFIKRFWGAHITNWSILDFDRHGSYSRRVLDPWNSEYTGSVIPFDGVGKTFMNTGSDMFYAAGNLFLLNGDTQALEWSKRLASLYVLARNENTKLGGTQYSITTNDRALEQFGPEYGNLITDSSILSLDKIESKYGNIVISMMVLGDKLGNSGTEFIRWGLEDLTAFSKYIYEPGRNLIYPVITNGERILPGNVVRDGYYGTAENFEPINAGCIYFLAFSMAYRLTGNDLMYSNALSVARGNNILDKYTSNMDPIAIFGLLELYKKTHKSEYLSTAMRIADNIIDYKFDNGFFLEDQDCQYAKFDNISSLALLTLAAHIDGKPSIIPVYPGSNPRFSCNYDGIGRIRDDYIYNIKK